MIIEYPEYFETFRCIAGSCPDTCCSTWEVDVDDDSFYYYQVVEGEFGEKLRKNIVTDGEDRYFPMREDGYCPFLTKDRLCEIQCRLGAEYVCKVCTEYPRYYMEIGDYQQLDISLSCIEMARIFFSSDEKIRYVRRENDAVSDREPLSEPEEALLRGAIEKRGQAVGVLQDGQGSLAEKLRSLGLYFEESDGALVDLVSDFEVLNGSWEEDLRGLQELCAGPGVPEAAAYAGELERQLTRFAVYLSWRYIIDASLEAEEELDFLPEARLICRCIHLVRLLCLVRIRRNGGTFGRDDLIDIAHGFSKEVEHSDENLERMKFA